MTLNYRPLALMALSLALAGIGCKKTSSSSSENQSEIKPEQIQARAHREEKTINTTCGPNGCTTEEIITSSGENKSRPVVKDESFSVTYSCGPDGCTKTIRNSDGTVTTSHSSSSKKYSATASAPKMNFSFESTEGSDIREISTQNLKATTTEKETHIKYKIGEESFNLVVDKKDKAVISGKILTNNTTIQINPKTQKCTITRKEYEDDHYMEMLVFSCSDQKVKLNGEALIPRYLGPGVVTLPEL